MRSIMNIKLRFYFAIRRLFLNVKKILYILNIIIFVKKKTEKNREKTARK